MTNERVKIVLADNILAGIIYEKQGYSLKHFELYQITKDEYDLQKAEEYAKSRKGCGRNYG